jgi:hypothetical protein
MANNVIAGNISEYLGGGVYWQGLETDLLVNNTIVDNEGCGVHCPHGYGVTLANSILRGNIPAQIDSSGNPKAFHCNVEGGWPGSGNIDQDPAFVDAANDDYHLTWPSPCREAGDNNYIFIQLDWEGDPRIAGGVADMGADEFYTHLYVTGSKTPGCSVEGKLVGEPGTSPVGLFFGSGVLDDPVQTAWGFFGLEHPWFMVPLVPIPGDGVLKLPATIPLSPAAPYDVPMQGLIGLTSTSLTNVEVLEVR